MADAINVESKSLQPIASRKQFLAANPTRFDGESMGGMIDMDRTLTYYDTGCPQFHIDIVGRGDRSDGVLEIKIRNVADVPDSVSVWVQTPGPSNPKQAGARPLSFNRFELHNVAIVDREVQEKICEILADDSPILSDR